MSAEPEPLELDRLRAENAAMTAYCAVLVGGVDKAIAERLADKARIAVLEEAVNEAEDGWREEAVAHSHEIKECDKERQAWSLERAKLESELAELRDREVRICDVAFDAAPGDIDHELHSHADTVPDWFRKMGAALETIKLIVSEAVKEHEPPQAGVTAVRTEGGWAVEGLTFKPYGEDK